MPPRVTLWNHVMYNPTDGEHPEDIGFAISRCADLAALLSTWAAGQIERGPSTVDADSLAGVGRIARMIQATLEHVHQHLEE